MECVDALNHLGLSPNVRLEVIHDNLDIELLFQAFISKVSRPDRTPIRSLYVFGGIGDDVWIQAYEDDRQAIFAALLDKDTGGFPESGSAQFDEVSWRIMIPSGHKFTRSTVALLHKTLPLVEVSLLFVTGDDLSCADEWTDAFGAMKKLSVLWTHGGIWDGILKTQSLR
ncbi:uncharacterized protein FIBRA_08517 [Fibroporia radiculosa]|uniref:Uncharacterized protein n=1 Tax=Fibroporia radiculosa TaxID=599839 RepID=J4I2W0_9APHY|nr:uncharacterized protein FIBRA_08517 [Fibroporia radiculosa]CCM06267.1 predicted protein [Fibroporia radiculosa]